MVTANRSKLKLWFCLGYASLLVLSAWVERGQHVDDAQVERVVESNAEEDLVLFFPAESGGGRDWVQRLAELRGRNVWIAPVGPKEGLRVSVNQWLNAREDASLHLIGVGLGGAEALAFSESLGDRVSSISLLDSIVSPRFELLGDRSLNRALKAFRLAVAWVLDIGVPDFGYMEKTPVGYARSARTFGANLGETELIFESTSARLLVGYTQKGGSNWDLAMNSYQRVRPDLTLVKGRIDPQDLAWFWDSAESSPLAEGTTFEGIPGVTLDAWFAGALLAVATFASEDLACIGGGILAASGTVSLATAILGCLIGIFIGDLGIYLIGRVFGATALEMPVLRRLASKKSLERGARWFEKRGVALVVLTRFFPGSRVPTYFAAGVVGVGWIRFTFALLLASAIWTPILVLASYFLGEPFLALFEGVGTGGWLAVVLFVACFILCTRLLGSLLTWKGRRLLYSRWRRLVAWEYWPVWAVYAPVVPYICWQAIRHRSLSLPFSVNPCMPASGLVYESKSQILGHLQKFRAPIARYAVIDLKGSLETKLQQLDEFLAKECLDFPVVLKPDIGQRGQGVTIVKSRDAAERFFRFQEEDTIVQEYIPGSEYGVFYHRFANREHGEVSSITDKRMTSVVGDGKSNLERLILSDPRAVGMARFFLREFESELETVPEKGERFWLASVGTHCRGALFLDGESLMTAELLAAVDEFSRKIEGFHFGRYDLRVPSPEHLRRGEGIRIIELNGITSEPTNMYDPKHSAFYGWRSLMRQWRLIFALAKENRLAGHEPVSVKFVLKLAIGYWRGVPSRDLS